MKKISIITASYNSEKYIEHTIQSVIEQTYNNIEYIIVDGGSTDATLSIIERYKEKIQTFISEPDNGVYDAFNKGIKASKGDVIYFLNSDDYLVKEDILEEVMKFFERNPEKAMVYGNILVKNEESGFIDLYGREFNLDDLKAAKMPPHPGLFIKSEMIKKYNGFSLDYKIASDFDLITRIFINEFEQIAYLNLRIACFRYGGLSSSLKNKNKLEEEATEIVRKHFGITYKPRGVAEESIGYYKRWLESLLLLKMPLSNTLVKRGINKVALFGTMEIALCVLEDMNQSDIEVLAFLDNNSSREGITMRGVTIFPPNWLQNNSEKIDAIILSIEGNYENEIKNQISSLISYPIPVFSWKELIEMC